MAAAGAAVAPNDLWMKSPGWDLALLAWPWVPLLVWLELSVADGFRVEPGSALAVGFSVVFALEFTHRQYTYYVAYGDTETFRNYTRRFVIAPLVVVPLAIAFYLAPRSYQVGAILVLAAWNVWHVVMQRFGLLRIYSAKAKGGLESAESRRRDVILVWTLVLGETCLTYVLHHDAAAQSEHGRRLLHFVDPVLGAAPVPLAVTGAGLTLGVFAWWLRGELSLPLAWRERVPRWSFLASTVALLAVFVVSGPLVGFLCFTLSHAVEYLAFVHLYEKRRFEAPNSLGGFMAPLMRLPLRLAPVLVAVHVGAYLVWIDPHRALGVVLVYIGVTNVLHFLYDGWIWKVRKPAAHRPLFAQAS